MNRRTLLYLSLCFISFIAFPKEKYLVDKIAISVVDSSREFAYTNKETAFFYSETNSNHRSSWQGFNVYGKEFLEDYLIELNGYSLTRNLIEKTVVFPHQLKRFFKNGVVETVTLLDSLPVIILEVDLQKKCEISFYPIVSDFKRKEDFIISSQNHYLLIARKNHTKRTEKQNYPVYLGIAIRQNIEFLDGKEVLVYYSPAGIKFIASRFKVAIGVGDDSSETIKVLNYALKNSDGLIRKRKERMEKLLVETFVTTENEDFNRALMWAKISLDALIMNQVTKGIFAGLPWFNNYWGRDSFISLPGATLVTGNYSEARKILESFAVFQDQDEKSINFGRIPNIITTTHKSYNTADGTPRFVIAAFEYFKYTGDKNFVETIFPYIERAVEGSLKYRTDQYYFLTHDDADTWMDAVGPDGPWTPRGNRANDVQALWFKQLLCSAEFAKVLNKNELATKWTIIANTLRSNFQLFFVDTTTGFIYDHLRIDNARDKQNRPNQIFCVELLSKELRSKTLANVIRNLTFVHGVASLSQDDEKFHPYHQNLPFYVKDAAYHQGTVWTWLSGPVISELCYFDCPEKAYVLTQNLVHQILNRGAVGTLSELLDAHPRKEGTEPDLSGTFSQAWSLAEFIRNFYQDYLNINFNFQNERIVYLNPQIPSLLGDVKAKIKFGKESFVINYSEKGKPSIKIEDVKIVSPITLVIELSSNNKVFSCSTKIYNSSQLKVTINDDLICQLKPSKWKSVINIRSQESYFRESIENVPFALPRISFDYPVLRPPSYRLLTNTEIKKQSKTAKNLIDVTDPAFDDTGYTGYKYPLNVNFVDGILDILKFKVDYDEENVYFSLKFRKLSNPGWHPEYGFQLTYVAIAIDQDRKKSSGRTNIGMNSKYYLDDDNACERIIFVGGGLRIEDEASKIVASYFPIDTDVKNPLGDVSSATISFCLPVEIIGKPNSIWNFNVLVGAQDDHGGAGLGDFRNIDSVESEWSGGGKLHPDLPNIYDFLRTN